MANTMEFEMKSTVVVDIDELEDELERNIPFLLADYQGLTDDEIEAVDLNAIKEAVASKWLGKLS